MRGRDNPGILAYTMPDSTFYQRGAHAPLTWARGDRAFLSQEVAGAGSPTVMDILLEGGLTKLRDEYPLLHEEAKTKVCDWGRVEATYMVDVIPPGSDLGAPQGKWLGNPGGDPDWSKVYEEAVWFVPVPKGGGECGCDAATGLGHPYWVKLQDDQGNWRMASTSGGDHLAVVAYQDQKRQEEAAGINVTLLSPSWDEHYVNLHRGLNHTHIPISEPLDGGTPEAKCAQGDAGYEELGLRLEQLGDSVCVGVGAHVRREARRPRHFPEQPPVGCAGTETRTTASSCWRGSG